MLAITYVSNCQQNFYFLYYLFASSKVVKVFPILCYNNSLRTFWTFVWCTSVKVYSLKHFSKNEFPHRKSVPPVNINYTVGKCPSYCWDSDAVRFYIKYSNHLFGYMSQRWSKTSFWRGERREERGEGRGERGERRKERGGRREGRGERKEERGADRGEKEEGEEGEEGEEREGEREERREREREREREIFRLIEQRAIQTAIQTALDRPKLCPSVKLRLSEQIPIFVNCTPISYFIFLFDYFLPFSWFFVFFY